ncbi:hypothetical protein Y1Q_0018912 [Alligator mississippiensis]|uniref:Secreted protein n=1 Tax=Alligator mississippiensis TaxID=8496 RepID=A0A151M362_ALLMI|nr:hypothetical protein Y1Q_0018912 [Alligator mississippiensis]
MYSFTMEWLLSLSLSFAAGGGEGKQQPQPEAGLFSGALLLKSRRGDNNKLACLPPCTTPGICGGGAIWDSMEVAAL